MDNGYLAFRETVLEELSKSPKEFRAFYNKQSKVEREAFIPVIVQNLVESGNYETPEQRLNATALHKKIRKKYSLVTD